MTRFRLLAPGAVAPLLFALFSTGCDSLTGTEARFADNARVRVSGEAAVPLLLVTSWNFVGVRDFETGGLITTLITADTARITSLPFERNVPLTGRDRFLARLVNPDENTTVTVHMQVELDGHVAFTQWATMRAASLEYTTSFHGN